MTNNFILISYGRSGSSFISSTLSSIFNTKYDKIGEELFGSGIRAIKKTKDPTHTMLSYFNKWKNDKYVGFHWKPYSLDDKYIKLLDDIKSNNIKIILNYRNPLHIFVSITKHAQNKIKGHYSKFDKRLKKVREIKITLSINKLLKFIKHYNNLITKVINLLQEKNIEFIQVNYKTLSDKNMDEWSKIFKHINPEFKINKKNKKNLKKILDNPRYEITTLNEYDKIIINYSEVSEALKKNNYNNLL